MSSKLNISDTFSFNIKRLREEKGWNQAELARQASLTSASVNQLEKGTRNPTLAVSSKIANALDAEVSDLFDENTERNRSDEEKFFHKFKVLNQLTEEEQGLVMDLAKKLANK